MRLYTKTLLLFSAAGLAILTVVGALQFMVVKERTMTGMHEQIGKQLGHLDLAVTRFLQDVECDVLGLAADQRIITRDDEEFTTFLNADDATFTYRITPREEEIISVLHAFYLSHPHVNSAYMGRENGSFVRSHKRARPTRYDPRDRPWYTLAKDHPGQVMRTPPYRSVTTDDINIGVVTALLGEHENILGVVGADITLTTLTDYISSFQVSYGGQVMLLDVNGTVLAARDKTMIFENVRSIFPNGQSLLQSQTAPFVLLDGPSEQFHAYVHNSQGTNWKFIGLVPQPQVQKHISQLVLENLQFLAAAIILLSLASILGLNRSILAPLAGLTKGTQHVRTQGDLAYRFQASSRDEIRELAEAFNQMLEALDSSSRELRASRQTLQEERNLLDTRVQERTRELETLNMALQREVEERARAEKTAEKANQAKSLFLASMSHEIRTPLNAVLGFTQLLLMDPQLGPAQRRSLETVHRSGEHLLMLLNDILEMSKIEAGRVETHPVHFDLWSLLEDLEATFVVLTRQAGLTLEVFKTDDLPRWVLADEQKLRQILHNLLGNAVKFTESGGIVLRAALQPVHLETAARLRFEVEDSGPGIPEDSRGSIFRTFEQLAADKTRKGGTGLGLAISKAYVELMGGNIAVSGQMGVGSVFSFDLPFTPGQTQEGHTRQTSSRITRLAEGQDEIRILVVDDNDANREILSTLLRLAGFSVQEAADGQAACDLFSSWNPQMILLDMIMPVMDGFQVLESIRTTEAGRAVPIIAVTASVLREDENRVLAAGAVAFLKKPFKAGEIYALLEEHLGVRYQKDDANDQPTAQVPSDSIRDRQAIRAISAHAREELRQAAISLDVERLGECIELTGRENRDAAAVLERLLFEFRFEAIRELLDAAEQESEEDQA